MRSRLALTILAATALGSWRSAEAASFSAGSLIIPTDECYQAGATNAAPWSPSTAYSIREGWNSAGTSCTYADANSNPSTATDPFYGTCWASSTSNYGASSTGLQHAFGVLFLLAKNNIPVSVIDRTNKQALGDYDFFITPTDSGNPVYYLRWSSSAYTASSLTSTGGSPIYYRGAPFVIDAAYAQQAITLLTTTNASNSIFSDVTIHVARADFDAPVASVIATTPKPIGVVNYSNSNGYNTALKYLTDAGIIYAISGSTSTSGGAGSAYVAISVSKNGNLSYTWSGAPSAACTSGKCTTLTYTPSGGSKTKILDVVWAPDMNQATCQDVQPNPNCFDSSGSCQTDTCTGPSAWCCPSSTGSPPTSYTSTFDYANPDGTTTAYYCPCPQAGTSGSSDQCTITSWQYQDTNAACVADLNSASNNGCSNKQTCDYAAQQCLDNCSNDNGCPTGWKCVTASTGPTNCTSTKSSDNCPSGYTCDSSNVCTTSQKVCVPSQGGLNPASSTPCSPACDSSSYCDTTDNTCKPKWGCEVTCNSCPSAGGSKAQLSNVWSTLSTATGGFGDFMAANGTLLGTDSTAITAESSQDWITTAGLSSTSSGSASGAVFCGSEVSSAAATAGFTDSTPSYPSSNLNLQIGDYLYRTLGGNSPVYTMATGGSIRNTNVNSIAYSTGSSTWGFPVLTGPPGTCTSTAATSLGTCTTCTWGSSPVESCQIDPTQCATQGTTCGKVIYEGANNYGSSANSAPLVKVAGQHIVYDTLLNGAESGGGTAYATELSRSSPVQNPKTLRFYAATFDWKYTVPTSGSGITNWSPSAGTYPYTTGHFREFIPSTTDSESSFSTGAVWDVDNWLSGVSNGNVVPSRNIYFAVSGTSGYTLTAFTSANRTAVAKAMFGITSTPTAAQYLVADGVIAKVLANHHLGGIDYSTPAVIESPHGQVSGGATTRPTIAYFGAYDGMLHAVCVNANGATSTTSTSGMGQCYGSNPGSELWAIIPPSVLKQMVTAYNTNDWSSINVGGTIRVADVFDYLTPGSTSSKIWKTLLIFGTRKLGSVDALDISDPSVSNLNAADFRFLWEDNSTNTTPAMSATLGASIATPNTTGVGIVTSANSSSSTAGVTTFMLRLYDGNVLSSSTQTYSRTLPTIATTGVIPNSAPPLATILTDDSSGLDTYAYVSDPQGDILRVGLSSTGFTGSTVLFNASSNASCSTTACQPFGASPAFARRVGGNPSSVLLIASGGTDWVDTTSTARYYMYGIDPVGGTALFTRSLGTLTPVAGTTLPLRSYAQMTVVGTDSYVDGTTLSLNNTQQLLQPILKGGFWGEGVRFAMGATPTDSTVSTANYILPPTGTAFGGGFGSTVFTGTTAVSMGTNGMFQHGLTTAQQATSTPSSAQSMTLTQTRTFKVLSWFQIGQ